MIHPSLVLCTVPDKAALLAVSDQCLEAKIDHFVFHEADMGDEPTAFATKPVNGVARKIFKKLPLFAS